MTLKTCTKCDITKELDQFPKQAKQRDGHNSQCKVCSVKATQARQKTLEGLVKKIFHNQRMTTSKMGRSLPTYTEKELFNWMMASGYEALWSAWVNSGYDRWYSPSIDRKDNTKSYSLDNIQLLTWRENLDNQKKDNIAGRYLHSGSKAVDQLSLDGTFIRTYPSIAIAMRDIAGHRKGVSNITSVCTGKWYSAYGYKWRFSDTSVLH